MVEGTGHVTFVCGECRQVLAEKVHAGQLVNIVIRCGACGAHNETLD